MSLTGIAWPDTPVILLSGDLTSMTDDADEVDAAACSRNPYEAVMLLSVLRIAPFTHR